MSVTVARVPERGVIRCPNCGHKREVTDRSRRRALQQGGIPCVVCRGGRSYRGSRDGDLRFWLNSFGATVPKGMPVRDFIVAGGAPAALVRLAQQCYPDS